jgi:hypothetical protein
VAGNQESRGERYLFLVIGSMTISDVSAGDLLRALWIGAYFGFKG